MKVAHQATSTARMIWQHPENRGRRCRRLAGWVSWQIWQRFVRRPRVVPFHDGIRMVCHPHDHVTSLAVYCGLYDREEMRFLLAYLRAGDTFLDVGANVAPYSLLATRVQGVDIVAFEPGELARERLAANLRINDLEQSVTVVPSAVSDGNGVALMSTDLWATNSLVSGDFDGRVERVETVTLDSYVAGHPIDRVALIKVDVEGFEPEVLRGAASVIHHHRPALIVENNDVEAIRGFAADHGYSCVRFDVEGSKLARGEWPVERGGNLILVPEFDAAQRRVLGADLHEAHGA